MSAEPPLPPAGYQPAMRFEYPRLLLQVLGLVMFVVSIGVFLMAAWLLNGRPAGLPISFGTSIWEFLLMILMVFVTVVIHELIHGAAYQLLGYKVSYGLHPQMVAAYAAAFKQYQKRNHNIWVALAPVVVLTIVCTPLMGVPIEWVKTAAFTLLIVNTSGSVGDFYLTWYLSRLPQNALIYDQSLEDMFVFLPDGF